MTRTDFKPRDFDQTSTPAFQLAPETVEPVPAAGAPAFCESSASLEAVEIPTVSEVVLPGGKRMSAQEAETRLEQSSDIARPVLEEALRVAGAPTYSEPDEVAASGDDDEFLFTDDEEYFHSWFPYKGQKFKLKELSEETQKQAMDLPKKMAELCNTSIKNILDPVWTKKNLTFEQGMQIEVLNKALTAKALEEGLLDWTCKDRRTGEKRPCNETTKQVLPPGVKQVLKDRIVSLASGISEEEFFRQLNSRALDWGDAGR